MSGQYLALDVVNRDFLFFFGDFDFFCFFCWGQFLEFGHTHTHTHCFLFTDVKRGSQGCKGVLRMVTSTSRGGWWIRIAEVHVEPGGTEPVISLSGYGAHLDH